MVVELQGLVLLGAEGAGGGGAGAGGGGGKAGGVGAGDLVVGVRIGVVEDRPRRQVARLAQAQVGLVVQVGGAAQES